MTNQIRRLRWILAICLSLIAGTFPRVMFAVDYHVNYTDDDDGVDALPGNEICETIPGNGVCSLRAAVMEANARPGADVIHLPAGAVIVLTRPNPLTPDQDIVGAGGDLDLVNNDVTIDGNGATVDGSGVERVFHVAGNITAVLFNLTIRNGRDANGGGIFSQGHLTLNDCTVTSNVATTTGAGIYTANGVLTLNNTTVSNNQLTNANPGGGGLYVLSGTANVNDSRILNNTSSREGSSILNRGTLNVRRTLVSGNPVGSGGSAISNGGNSGGIAAGTVLIEDSLITLNNGGGVNNVNPGNLTIRRSTIHGNPGHVGLHNEFGGTATLEATTISGHTAAQGSGITNRAVLTLRAGCVIRDNVVNSGLGGSAIQNAGGTSNCQIFDTTIRNNRSTNMNYPDSAAILNGASGRMTLTRCLIEGNVGGNFGGGVHNAYNATSFTITGCTVRDNRALSPNASGIGVFSTSRGTITDTVFRGNVGSSNSNGGGLYSSGGLTGC